MVVMENENMREQSRVGKEKKMVRRCEAPKQISNFDLPGLDTSLIDKE